MLNLLEIEALAKEKLSPMAYDYYASTYDPDCGVSLSRMLKDVFSAMRQGRETHLSHCVKCGVGHLSLPIDGRVVHLTPNEFKLLTILIRNAGKVMTHRQLLKEVWGPLHTEDAQYLRIYIRQLRNKLEANPAHPRVLLTELGVGYRLRPSDEVAE